MSIQSLSETRDFLSQVFFFSENLVDLIVLLAYVD